VKLGDINFLDDLPKDDPRRLIASRPALLFKALAQREKEGRPSDETKIFFRLFESLVILRRGAESSIYWDAEKTRPLSLSDLLPRVLNHTVELTLGPGARKAYEEAFLDVWE